MATIGVMACVGCGGEKSSAPAPAPAPAVQALPSLNAGTPGGQAAPAPAPGTPAPGEVATPGATAATPAVAAGADVQAVINRALQMYNDPSSRPGAGDLTPEATKVYPPIKDLSDLVKAGFLKSIPPAPPGKEFKLDMTTLEVMVVDKK
jgi:hypothetical protein